MRGTSASDGYSVGRSGSTVEDSRDRPKGTGASDSYSVGCSGGALVPPGSSRRRPKGTVKVTPL